MSAVATIDILRSFQILIVILGGIVVYYGAKSFLKTKSRSMLLLIIGFLIVTVGGVSAGVLFEFLNFDLLTVDTVQAGTTVVGFLLIVLSIISLKD